MPLQQTTFENTVAKGEIAQNKQFIHLPKCFQLYSIIISRRAEARDFYF